MYIKLSYLSILHAGAASFQVDDMLSTQENTAVRDYFGLGLADRYGESTLRICISN